MKPACIALDLGTSSFKCGLVDASFELVGQPFVETYSVRGAGGEVTFPADDYVRIARRLMKEAAALADKKRLEVVAVGLSSQAQTYVPVGTDGEALADAVVWLDDRAASEAAGMACGFDDFPGHSGFSSPLGKMFLPKIAHLAIHQPDIFDRTWKFLLLNEYLVFKLTGETYGDTCNQGMGGFYDITRRRYSGTALGLAGIGLDKLADAFPAASHGAPMTVTTASELGLKKQPAVFSCGNDQSCSAAGAGLGEEGDALCNFGTAMVVYSPRGAPPRGLATNQIGGINPLTDKYFLLGVESECGNLFDKAYGSSDEWSGFEDMMRRAVSRLEPSGDISEIAAADWGEPLDATGRCAVLVKRLSDTFGCLLDGVLEGSKPRRLVVSGGLSRSESWTRHLERRHGLSFIRLGNEHPGLSGIAKIVAIKSAGRVSESLKKRWRNRP